MTSGDSGQTTQHVRVPKVVVVLRARSFHEHYSFLLLVIVSWSWMEKE
jgi:hypothetical protein